MDGSDPIRADAAAQPVEVREDERRASSWRLGMGTLACPVCDAPVALAAEAMAPADALRCPFCGNAGAVRDFLSLTEPSRPARVEIRVVHRSRRALR
jgi:hypothetical protein